MRQLHCHVTISRHVVFILNKKTNVEIDVPISLDNVSHKEIMVHSRHAYAFTKTFQLTGDEDYLVKAHDAMNQVYANGWDPLYGGWFVTFTEDWRCTPTTWTAAGGRPRWI